jgi:class 3 adenylate cyclase/outer membrane murein-binding lipoprotein Lpp
MSEAQEPLGWLESIHRRAKELRAEEAAVQERIRSGFVKRAVVFMDVVGSTEFKQTHAGTPEVWILRVRQFSELLAAAVGGAQGRVVKYIGDEVMAVFDNIYDAQNLVGRIEEIERNLAEVTGYETRIKVAADYGLVYFLKFPGHDEPDPQGPAVDRCARIGKSGQPGEVLASADFVAETPKLGWQKVGRVDLKGLGTQVIYQLGHVTVDLSPTLTVKEEEFKSLEGAVQELQVEVEQLKAKNQKLAEDLRAAGRQPDAADLAEGGTEQQAQWEQITTLLGQLRKLVYKASAPPNQYARFLFLWNTDAGGEATNSWDGRTFDESREAGLVTEYSDNFYVIDEEHPLNSRAIQVMRQVKYALEDYLEEYDQDADDLFRWSLSDPNFWDTYVGLNVTGP